MPESQNNMHQNVEVQEIMSRVPHWILRYGIALFGIILFAFLGTTFFIQYPDTVKAEVTIYSENPPARIISKVNGRIRNFFISKNEEVNIGKVLLELENSANYNSIIELRREIDTLKNFIVDFSPHLFKSIKNNNGLILGEIQNTYSRMSLSVDRFISFYETNNQSNSAIILKKNLINYKRLAGQKKNQVNLKNEDYELSLNKFKRDSLLFHKNILSKDEFDNSVQKKVKAELDLNSIKTEYLQSKIQIVNLENQLDQLVTIKKENKEKFKSELISTFNELVNELSKWETKYLLRSPIEGKVVYSDFWSENLNVKVGDNVISVIPSKKTRIHGIVKIPISSAGKIRVGNSVNILLVKYPYYEFGKLQGRVKNISKIHSNGYYNVYLELSDTLNTNYNKEIEFAHEMKGQAEIITEDKVLFDRLFEPLKSMFKN